MDLEDRRVLRRRLGLLRDLEPSEVAAAVVASVQDDRPQVRLPRRAAFAGALAEAPQALVAPCSRVGHSR
jgi:hypothetical protein